MARARPLPLAVSLGVGAALLALASSALSSAPARGTPPHITSGGGANAAGLYAWTRPVVVALGDSITEYAVAEGGWWRGLSGNYSRRADCVNRGLSGYNSRWALFAADEVVEAYGDRLAAALVWYGANDAKTVGTGGPQASVPVDEYGRNLRAIVRKLREAGGGHKGGGNNGRRKGGGGGGGDEESGTTATTTTSGSRWPVPSQEEGGAAVVLVTPPPLHEEMWLERMNSRAQSEGTPLHRASDRLNANVELFAQEARRAAEDAGAVVADVHRALVAAGAAKGDDSARLFYTDGLHLSPLGNEVALKAMQRALEGTAASPGRLPVHLPTFAQVDAHEPARTFGPLAERGYGPADSDTEGAGLDSAAAAA
jgi:isoamyl acetate esterase